MIDNTALQPCPFCGGKARAWDKSRYDTCIRCDDCNSQTGWEPTIADAIAAWNRRAEPDNDPKECPAMERVEGGIPYCADKQTACDGCHCAQPANEPLTHEEISKICLRNYIRKREEEREHD